MEHLLAKKSLKKQHLSLISLMNFPFAKTGGTTVVLLQIKDIAISTSVICLELKDLIICLKRIWNIYFKIAR